MFHNESGKRKQQRSDSKVQWARKEERERERERERESSIIRWTFDRQITKQVPVPLIHGPSVPRTPWTA